MSDHLLTQADYARRRKVSAVAVHKWVKAGKFPVHVKDGKKLIDPAEADFALDQNRARLNEPAAPVPIDDHGSASRTQTDGLTAARTETERYKAKTAELVYRQKIGELVPFADVESATKQCVAVLIRACEIMLTHADEITSAAVKDGIVGTRIKLKAMIRDYRQQVAATFVKMQADALAAGSATAEAPDADEDEDE